MVGVGNKVIEIWSKVAVHECFNKGAPLTDGVEGLVAMEMESIELGVTPVALDLFNTEVELFPLKIRRN